jgi:hypothetical protein
VPVIVPVIVTVILDPQNELTFFSFRLSDFLTLGALLLAFIKYVKDRGKDSEDRNNAREALIEQNTKRHMENQAKLERLENFHGEQVLLNRQRELQIAELREQTQQLKGAIDTTNRIADIVDRRLQRLEKLDDRRTS